MNKRLLCRTWTRLPHGEYFITISMICEMMMETDPQNKQRGSIHGIIIDFHLQGKSKNRAYARTVS